MQPITNFIKHPSRILLGVVKHTRNCYSDSTYLRLLYFFQMGEVLHLKQPRKYTEKIQWLKLHDRNPQYTKLVDKILVKDFVSQTISSAIVIPLLKVYDSVDDISLEKLPHQFVLKTNHSGGNTGVIVCKDKNLFNLEDAKTKLQNSLRGSAYNLFLEWPYKDVERKVFAEQYMEDETGSLMDYKFMCFNGEPKFVHICPDRNSGGQIHFDYYDMEWNKLPFAIEHPNSDIIAPKPKSFDKMLEYARILSAGKALSRIDFYEIAGKPYFGEITFYPYSGLERFDKDEWNVRLGDWIKLPIE